MIHHLNGVDQFISKTTSTNQREVMALKKLVKTLKRKRFKKIVFRSIQFVY